MAIWYYLAALVWPAGLSPIRPQWVPNLRNPLAWLPAIAAVAAPAAFWWKYKTWGRPLLFAYAYFIVMLLPVLGFVWMALMQETPSADWWQYMAAPGMFALAGGAIMAAAQKAAIAAPVSGPGRLAAYRLIGGTLGLLILPLGLLILQTVRREVIYQSMEPYCRAVTAEVPHAWTLQMNLGIMRKRDGDYSGAEACYRQALADNPRYVEARINLANALSATGDMAGAESQLRLAVQMRPGDPATMERLAMLYAAEGKAKEMFAVCDAIAQMARQSGDQRLINAATQFRVYCESSQPAPTVPARSAPAN